MVVLSLEAYGKLTDDIEMALQDEDLALVNAAGELESNQQKKIKLEDL